MSAVGKGVLLGFYGDDFTGSTDAMEVTAFAGLRTVLFTRVPDADMRARFADYDVVGIAGTSRARSPDWMEKHLPAAFEALASLGAPVIQYKVCSTFDSAPEIGSIGKATDIGMRIVGGRWSPSVIGAPHLGRWQVFGNLFAAAGGTNYRIDRHPTMSRHPVTPMSGSRFPREARAPSRRAPGRPSISGARLKTRPAAGRPIAHRPASRSSAGRCCGADRASRRGDRHGSPATIHLVAENIVADLEALKRAGCAPRGRRCCTARGQARGNDGFGPSASATAH